MKANQSGRSMIEMLGVLAIIGVLSIGGIAGYSKAMMKYRTNKTADQITQLSQNIRTLYSSQRGGMYNGLNAEVVCKAHLVPDEMFSSTNCNSATLVNPHGGSVYVSGSSGGGFFIEVYGLPPEACIELLTQDWGYSDASGLGAISVASGQSATFSALPDVASAASACTIGNGHPTSIDLRFFFK